MMKEPSDSGGILESLEETIQPMPGRECEPEGTHITDLPAVVLSSVLARINDPVDVACALCACRLFWTLSQSAPFHLRLRPRQLEKTPGGSCDDSLQSRYSMVSSLVLLDYNLVPLCFTVHAELLSWS